MSIVVTSLEIGGIVYSVDYVPSGHPNDVHHSVQYSVLITVKFGAIPHEIDKV